MVTPQDLKKTKNPLDTLNALQPASTPLPQSNLSNVTPSAGLSATAPRAPPNVGAESLSYPDTVAGRYAQNNLIPNTLDNELNRQIRAIYSGQRTQIEANQAAAMQRYLEMQAGQAQAAAAAQTQANMPLAQTVGNAVQLNQMPNQAGEDAALIAETAKNRATYGAAIGSLALNPATAAIGFAGGYVVGTVEGYSRLKENRKNLVAESMQNFKGAKTNMAFAINRLNKGKMSATDARDLFNYQIGEIERAERILQLQTIDDKAAYMSGGRDDLIKIQKFKEQIPQLIKDMQLAILQPNPLAPEVYFQDFQDIT